MDRLEAMSIFVAVVEAGSLAAAARKLGCSPASVTRAVAQLESSSSERLLERTTRRFSVTEAGARHVATYKTMLDELHRLEQPERAVQIHGTVVITAPELFGRLHVMPVVEDFLETYPETKVRVLLLNRMVDIVGEGVDVAIRLANLPDSSMNAIRIGEIRQLICAAPRYLARHATPAHPSELKDHVCIGLNEAGTHELWRYRDNNAARRTRSVRVTCRLSLNSAAAAIKAAERGIGLVRPLSYQVERQIAEGSLVALLQEYELEAIPVHMVFQPRKSVGSATRAFIDFAVARLGRRPFSGSCYSRA